MVDQKLSAGRCERDSDMCPLHAMPAAVADKLNPCDELVFPLHKRVVTEYAADDAGVLELRLYYGDKEISFDEVELFPFAEMLATQGRFVAGSAITWGPGYDWPRVQVLLEHLLAEGILRYAGSDDGASAAHGDGARPSPLPPAISFTPRSWLDTEEITTELTGRTLDLGYLEMIVPMFRVAHMALDAEQRQVGEANVFPKALRLDVPGSWRLCIYPGSRHHADKPMNVTALKSMRAHWPQMMLAVRHIREAYLQRFPASRAGWTVAHLERLAALVLAVPTWLMMRAKDPVQNGDLHPALSSLFRVTDGVRMTMHQMLMAPMAEPTLAPDAPMTSREIYAYSERNFSFFSETGVCAGPQAMIEEFLGVLVDGHPPRDAGMVELDPQLQEALDTLKLSMDYGLLGLQVHAAAFSVWPAMARTYAQLANIAEDWAAGGSSRVVAWRDRLRERIAQLTAAGYLATEARRVNREHVYADMYEQCAVGLGEPEPVFPLPDRIAALRSELRPQFEQELRALLQRRLADDADDPSPHLDMLVVTLADYFLQEQAILRVACSAQSRLNKLLGRRPPLRPFDAADMTVHNLLQGADPRRLPYLEDELADALSIGAHVDLDEIRIKDQGASSSPRSGL